MLASQDGCEIAKEMPSQGKDVLCSEIVMKTIEDLEEKNMSKCRQRKSVCARIGINFLLAPGHLFVWKRCKTKIDFSFLI